MIVALDPTAKVLGVIPREFAAPQSATAAGLRFHPIIRPFGPVFTSWRASRPLNSASTAGASSDGIKNNNENKDDNDSLTKTQSPTSPTAGADYTQVYNGTIKSYYTGTRPYTAYTNFPLLTVSRGTLLQVFTAFDPQSLPLEYRPVSTSTPSTAPNTTASPKVGEKGAPTPAPALPVSMEKIHIVSFPVEICATAWLNDNTLLIFTLDNPGMCSFFIYIFLFFFPSRFIHF